MGDAEGVEYESVEEEAPLALGFGSPMAIYDGDVH